MKTAWLQYIGSLVLAVVVEKRKQDIERGRVKNIPVDRQERGQKNVIRRTAVNN